MSVALAPEVNMSEVLRGRRRRRRIRRLPKRAEPEELHVGV